MEKKQKQWIRNFFIVLLFIVAILSYTLYYKSPAVRFAHRIFPLVYHSETISEYQKDSFAIRVENKNDITKVQFLSPEGLDQTFLVSQDGYEVSVFDTQSEQLLSGIWRGGRLCSGDGAELEEYRKMRMRLKLTSFSPEASDAVYIYKSYSTSTRGGKRAPVLLFLAVLLWLISIAKLDAGAVWERNLKYSLPMLNDYGKEDKSEKTKEGERIAVISVSILVIACVGILLYDIFCY